MLHPGFCAADTLCSPLESEFNLRKALGLFMEANRANKVVGEYFVDGQVSRHATTRDTTPAGAYSDKLHELTAGDVQPPCAIRVPYPAPPWTATLWASRRSQSQHRFPRLRPRLQSRPPPPNRPPTLRGLAGDPPHLPTLSLTPRFCPNPVKMIPFTTRSILAHEKNHWLARDSMIFEHMRIRAQEEAEPYMFTALMKAPSAHPAMEGTHLLTAGGRHSLYCPKEGCCRSS